MAQHRAPGCSPAPSTAAPTVEACPHGPDRVLAAQIKRTTPKLLARYDNELDLLTAATEALEDSEMLGQPDPDGIDYDPEDPDG